MRKLACSRCGERVYFDNTACLACGSRLGFLPNTVSMVAFDSREAGSPAFHRLQSDGVEQHYQLCANERHGVCNWLAPAVAAGGLCVACSLNRTIPNLSEPGSQQAWAELEKAKRRLVYSLMRFGLSLGGSGSGGAARMTFDFVRHASSGHLDGVITVNVSEANSAERERQRLSLDEPYRTLIGHLRHESGHYYWDMLVQGSEWLDAFRALFGDEREDYVQAIARHHASAPPEDWAARHISAYASAHPWEDWAETWAHYLHMVSVVDTADAEGLEPRATGLLLGAPWPFAASDVYREGSFNSLIQRWMPLTVALNELSRAMGHAEFYPFVTRDAVIEKLTFVHDRIRHR